MVLRYLGRWLGAVLCIGTSTVRIALIAMLVMTVLGSVDSKATTYYIDFVGGNDANNGTSKATPWKRQPYMNGFSGAPYIHTQGDRFIFKGGVTWPSSCFVMAIHGGGNSATILDYYGSDQTWFSGGAWTRPLFDFQHTVYGNNLSGAAIICDGNWFSGGLMFDGLELAHQRSRAAANFCSASLFLWGVDNIIVTNCFIHDWDMDTYPVAQESGYDGGLVSSCSGCTNTVATHCTFTTANVNVAASTVAVGPSPATSGTTLTLAPGSGVNFPTNLYFTTWSASTTNSVSNSEVMLITDKTGDVFTVQRARWNSTARSIQAGDPIVIPFRTGSSCRDIQWVNHCEFYQVIEAVLGGGTNVSNCHIHDMPNPTDPGVHNNAIEVFWYTTISNNVIHDLDPHTLPISMGSDFVVPGLAGTNYVINNVMWNLGGQTPMGPDTGGNPSQCYTHIWNNTVRDDGWIVRTPNRGQGTNWFALVDMRNNHFITSQNPPYTFTAPNGAPVTTVIFDHNLTQTAAQAAAAGYFPSSLFQPSSISQPTVDAGLPLGLFNTDANGVLRPQIVTWDIGAWELSAPTPPPPPPSGFVIIENVTFENVTTTP